MEVSGYFHTPAGLLPARMPGTHCKGGWVGFRDGLDVLEKRKIFCRYQIRTTVRPARRYADYAEWGGEICYII
jgi:hypothetical protein